MKYLPASIGNLTKLEYLDLSNNQLVELPQEIGRLTNLRELYFQRNNLTTLPDSIVNIIGLEQNIDLFRRKFDMARNHICSLPPEVSKWVDITLWGTAYDDENYESYEDKGAWKISQCNDCPEGQMNCQSSVGEHRNKHLPQLQTLPSTGYLFDLRGRQIGAVAGRKDVSRLPQGCYIVRYGDKMPRFRRIAVP
ncbi:MAG: leucine-rich repeat domain-containing protein [Chitinispirillaceae bacterium]|nr:leucine-rich repeat domain-containing protein [Chitinispirillaceae bacterium]